MSRPLYQRLHVHITFDTPISTTELVEIPDDSPHRPEVFQVQLSQNVPIVNAIKTNDGSLQAPTFSQNEVFAHTETPEVESDSLPPIKADWDQNTFLAMGMIKQNLFILLGIDKEIKEWNEFKL